jgi:hypothetical protein
LKRVYIDVFLEALRNETLTMLEIKILVLSGSCFSEPTKFQIFLQSVYTLMASFMYLPLPIFHLNLYLLIFSKTFIHLFRFLVCLSFLHICNHFFNKLQQSFCPDGSLELSLFAWVTSVIPFLWLIDSILLCEYSWLCDW